MSVQMRLDFMTRGASWTDYKEDGVLSRVKKQPMSAARRRPEQHRCEGKDSEIRLEEAAGWISRSCLGKHTRSDSGVVNHFLLEVCDNILRAEVFGSWTREERVVNHYFGMLAWCNTGAMKTHDNHIHPNNDDQILVLNKNSTIFKILRKH